MNVIQLDKYRIKREPDGTFSPGCNHYSLILKDKGEFVYCEDCNENVSPYWAIKHLSRAFRDELEKLTSATLELEIRAKEFVHTKAAKEIERAWRGGKYAVTCPHCQRGILPQDSLGWRSKELEMARRAKEAKDKK